MQVFNCYKPYLLVEGPRESGKTVACLHRLMRHAWETPQARIAMFARTRKSADQGGVFTDLVQTIVPEWVNANIGLEICSGKKNAREPLTDGGTRLLYLDVTNSFGNKSRIQLHSLDFDWDIEAAVRSTRFSCIFFSELSNFKDRIVFTITAGQLRMPHLPDSAHQWIADTNPCPEGRESWQWKLFHGERLADNHPYPSEQAKYEVIHISIPENPFISESRKMAIAARHAHDSNLMDRYYHGLWTSRTEDGLFSDVFMPAIHVIGKVDAFDENESELLLPSETCSTMITAWDPGSKNHSTHIMEKALGEDGRTIFCILDEIVSLHTALPITDFTELVLERMDFWDDYIKAHCHQNPYEWKHWSDMSSFDQFRAGLGGYDHSAIAVASGGRIMLMACPKGRNSVSKRVDILHRLLFQNRIYVSAKCVKTIEMLGAIRKGKTSVDPVERSDLKHVFDSLTYGIGAESFWELGEVWAPRVGSTDSMVHVRL